MLNLEHWKHGTKKWNRECSVLTCTCTWSMRRRKVCHKGEHSCRPKLAIIAYIYIYIYCWKKIAIVQMNQDDEPWVVSWKTGARCYPCISQVWDLSDWGLAKPFAVALTEQGLYIIWICLDMFGPPAGRRSLLELAMNWLRTGWKMVGNPFRITSMIISQVPTCSNHLDLGIFPWYCSKN